MQYSGLSGRPLASGYPHPPTEARFGNAVLREVSTRDRRPPLWRRVVLSSSTRRWGRHFCCYSATMKIFSATLATVLPPV